MLLQECLSTYSSLACISIGSITSHQEVEVRDWIFFPEWYGFLLARCRLHTKFVDEAKKGSRALEAHKSELRRCICTPCNTWAVTFISVRVVLCNSEMIKCFKANLSRLQYWLVHSLMDKGAFFSVSAPWNPVQFSTSSVPDQAVSSTSHFDKAFPTHYRVAAPPESPLRGQFFLQDIIWAAAKYIHMSKSRTSTLTLRIYRRCHSVKSNTNTCSVSSRQYNCWPNPRENGRWSWSQAYRPEMHFSFAWVMPWFANMPCKAASFWNTSVAEGLCFWQLTHKPAWISVHRSIPEQASF